MKKALFLTLLFLFSSTLLNAQDCFEEYRQERRVKVCQKNDQTEIHRYFPRRDNTIASIEVMQNERRISYATYNIQGVRVTLREYEYLEDGSYFETRFNRHGEVTNKGRYQLVNGVEYLVEKHGLNRDSRLEYIDYFSFQGDIVKRDYFEGDRHLYRYQFIYQDDLVLGFDLYDENGQKIGHYIKNDPPQEALESQVDPKVKIAVIDSGFDFFHPELQGKFFVSDQGLYPFSTNQQNIPLFGVYYDERGTINFADYLQFNQSPSNSSRGESQVFSIPFEKINLSRGGRIDSHGTHVASLALRELKEVALYAFAGDFGSARYLEKISKTIRHEKIDFVNLSFSFPDRQTQMIPNDTYHALEKLFSDNPQTVFFVAAGNDGRELTHLHSACVFPACYSYPNVLTIGATADSDWRDDDKYERASFSNYSEQFVDLFAPGKEVEGALIGGQSVRYSGTSMATPLALNVAAKIKEHNPHLEPLAIAQMLKNTALRPQGFHGSRYGVVNESCCARRLDVDVASGLNFPLRKKPN